MVITLMIINENLCHSVFEDRMPRRIYEGRILPISKKNVRNLSGRHKGYVCARAHVRVCLHMCAFACVYVIACVFVCVCVCFCVCV